MVVTAEAAFNEVLVDAVARKLDHCTATHIAGEQADVRFAFAAQGLQKLRHTGQCVAAEVRRLEAALEVSAPTFSDLPKAMRPMTWEMACEMSLSGHVDIGGHTHTHPILARCDIMAMRAEIATCRDRIHAELGELPFAFAYPNGGPDDFTRETLMLVREAGFKAACTTICGRVHDTVSMHQLPRYGSPESVLEAKATVSGAFETLKDWRQSCLKAMSMI